MAAGFDLHNPFGEPYYAPYSVTHNQYFQARDSLIDYVHIALDLVGLVPWLLVGEVADGVNTLLYLANDDPINASISAASIFGGDALKAARSIRAGLIRLTGFEKIGYHAHHVFPWALRDQFFTRFGVNVSDPRFGAWWEWRDHLANADAYQKDWERWLIANPNATWDDAIEEGRRLAEQYGFEFPK